MIKSSNHDFFLNLVDLCLSYFQAGNHLTIVIHFKEETRMSLQEYIETINMMLEEAKREIESTNS